MFNFIKRVKKEEKAEIKEEKIVNMAHNDSVREEINCLARELLDFLNGNIKIEYKGIVLDIFAVSNFYHGIITTKSTLDLNGVNVIINAGSETFKPYWVDWVIESGKKDEYEKFIIEALKQAVKNKRDDEERKRCNIIEENIKKIGI